MSKKSVAAVTLCTAVLVGPIVAFTQSTRRAERPGAPPQRAAEATEREPQHVWGDIDGDGLSDLYAVNPAGEDRLLRNLGDGRFEDVTSAAQLAGQRGTKRALWQDFDGDGQIDLLLVRGSGDVKVFRAIGGGAFEDATAGAGLAGVSQARDAHWLDYDRDGRVDLQVRAHGGPQLYYNLGDGSFEEVALGLPTARSEGRSGRGIQTEAEPGELEAGDASRGDPGGEASHLDGGRASAPRPGGRDAERSRGPVPARDPVGNPEGLGAACADTLTDQATGNCSVQASSDGVLGMLYPLSEDFNVTNGYVGIGTASPAAPLDVVGPAGSLPAARFGHSGNTSGYLQLESVSGSSIQYLPGITGFEDSDGQGLSALYFTGIVDNDSASHARAAIVLDGRNPDGTPLANRPILDVRSAPNKLKLRVAANGNVGIGTGNPSAKLQVEGGNLRVGGTGAASALEVIPNSFGAGADLVVSGGRLSIISDSTEPILLSGGDVGIGSTAYPNATLDVSGSLRVDDDLLVVDDATDYIAIQGELDVSGEVTAPQVTAAQVGIGTGNPAQRLHVYSNGLPSTPVLIEQESAGAGAAIQFRNKAASNGFNVGQEFDAFAHAFTIGQSASPFTRFLTIGLNGNVGVGTTNPTTKLDVNGETRTKILQITGGSDLVEAFDTGTETCEPGTVVVIDPERPGELKASSSAYDKKVAGVVSGAGGINPGICMGQEGVADGDTLVAMTGRVYVKCTTENGAIEPGDLLTTSGTAGCGMKATDAGRSNGSVLGKAMTALDEDTGLVLVLVNLQ